MKNVFDPVINVLLPLLAALLLGVGTWAISRLVKWLNLKNAELITASLNDALHKSVAYGLQQSHDLIHANGWNSIEVKNKTLGTAFQYMIDRFPDTLKAVGVDPLKPDAIEKVVTSALDRVFPQAASIAASSPVTPPVTITGSTQVVAAE